MKESVRSKCQIKLDTPVRPVAHIIEYQYATTACETHPFNTLLSANPPRLKAMFLTQWESESDDFWLIVKDTVWFEVPVNDALGVKVTGKKEDPIVSRTHDEHTLHTASSQQKWNDGR